MNPDKNTRLFILVLAVGLLLVGTTVFIQGQMLGEMRVMLGKISSKLEKMDAVSSTDSASGKIGTQKYCDTNVGGTGLCFNYPQSWSVSQHDDDFTSGEKILEIAANVAEGRVTIDRLEEGQKGMKGPRVNAYPGLYSLGELCSDDDGLTCPQNAYYLTLDGDQTAYAVRVYYRWADRNEVQPLIDTILYSIETGM